MCSLREYNVFSYRVSLPSRPGKPWIHHTVCLLRGIGQMTHPHHGGLFKLVHLGHPHYLLLGGYPTIWTCSHLAPPTHGNGRLELLATGKKVHKINAAQCLDQLFQNCFVSFKDKKIWIKTCNFFSGKLEHELHPHSATLLLSKCMDEVLKQVGVTFK